MKRVTLRSFVVGSAFCLTLTQNVLAQDFPARKAGLWEISMQTDGSPRQGLKHCVDEKTDKQMQQLSQGAAESCKVSPLRKEGNSLVSEQQCTFGKQNIASRSVITGDFQSKIRTEVSSTYTPPLAGRATGKTLVEAKWTGACPSGWKPGDMEMPGGGRMNVNQMMEGVGKNPKR